MKPLKICPERWTGRLACAVVSIPLILVGIAAMSVSTQAAPDCQSLFINVDPEEVALSDADLNGCRAIILEKAAEDDVSGLILKSRLALRGVGEKKSRRTARMALETASALDSALAKRLLADLLVERVGADAEDFEQAESLYLAAARLGDDRANAKLAELYVAGRIPRKSAADAEMLFKTAVESDAGAKLGRARIILSRATDKAALKQASTLLAEAAELGNPEAAFLFAILNLSNDGLSDTPPAELDAVLCRSAEAGHPPAMFECAKRRIAGSDRQTAMALLERAAGAGHIESIEYLADLYARTGSAADFARAKTLWFRAATLGSDPAKLALLYRHDSLTEAEKLNFNGAFSIAEVFTTDIGRIMLGNHYLSLVERGLAGEYIQGEYWYYGAALNAFTLVAQSQNETLAAQARQVADRLRSQKENYEKDLEARRLGREVQFWIGVASLTVGILSLTAGDPPDPSTSYKHDRCAGISGLAWFGVSPGAIAFGGCDPYRFN